MAVGDGTRIWYGGVQELSSCSYRISMIAMKKNNQEYRIYLSSFSLYPLLPIVTRHSVLFFFSWNI